MRTSVHLLFSYCHLIISYLCYVFIWKKSKKMLILIFIVRLLIRPHLRGFVRILGPLSAHIFRKSEKIHNFENFQNLDTLIKSVFFCINIQCPHKSAFLLTIIHIFDRNLMSSLFIVELCLRKIKLWKFRCFPQTIFQFSLSFAVNLGSLYDGQHLPENCNQ